MHDTFENLAGRSTCGVGWATTRHDGSAARADDAAATTPPRPPASTPADDASRLTARNVPARRPRPAMLPLPCCTRIPTSTSARTPPSDADALRQELAVVRGVAEEDLGALRALEVEVRVVLPREADAAVD